VADAAEVRIHLGFGFGAEATAHFGWYVSEDTAIVVAPPAFVYPPTTVEPAYFAQSGGAGAGGGAGALAWRIPSRHAELGAIFAEVTDEQMREAAEQATELAQTEEFQAWASKVLTTAAMSGCELQTDTAVAEVLLESVQIHGSAPLVKASQAAAAFLCAGLSTYLALHGSLVLNRPLTTVYVDGRWQYADPTTDYELGAHQPYTQQRYYTVPDLPVPSTVAAEIEALRATVRQQEAEIDELRRAVQGLRAQMQMQADLAGQTAAESAAQAEYYQAATSAAEALAAAETARAELYRALLVAAATGLGILLVLWLARPRALASDTGSKLG
jgi:hypothetical protein